ncbi:SDR family oxidoreductase [Burkholderia thailandensis]|uniref:SDR family oxidoreductase n=1 Tax=Burkholderia thailandensis TaxID=57975 RepID=UPI0001B4103F|nr:SDR family oxidoreductase [Burkholderia thailandensis]AHI76850.1 3-beta hydroxysteroid dehydrogenase/isomerase family protein [Burkholderia thailandensis 2002721723]AIP28733.1 3-beta hydroxysteroid dehydrogenase/isomerase family protein [Burkholderia thailandensis E264]AIT23508.1 3-beta hydroxysteroid dehydrogenase/isomerase family protein [Burkholderia thailandensis E254]AJY00837.1 3-beta hydroxysteroid dehydrogenase/isomerase family protein [Burkholderia thailandensis 2002721643]AVR06216.
MNNLDVAIIGMSGAFPGASDVREFWRNLESGRCSLERYSEQELLDAGVDPAHLKSPKYVPVGGRMRDIECFDNEFFGISNHDARLMDPQQRVFLQLAWHAFEDAGFVPGAHPGRVGVYAGVSLNSYLHTVVFRSDEVDLDRDGQSILFGNLSDYLTTRLSYLLDLKGPSVNIQTACSTSLVAIHEACQGLLSYQADVALAGACSINVPNTRGYLYSQDSFFSPDGQVRAFDEQAAGTVFSNGAGLVVLKRLEDALRDNDQIYAVLKASAVNNDGSDKVGYAAPSVSGQSAVIRDALHACEIRPEQIQYVETHGTGTSLGDPIEIAALTQAYAADRRRGAAHRPAKCAIGSVKTNIGHIDVAAGVAGVIKTALALRHKTLPASLGFEKANPRLGLENGPFYVNDRTQPWASDTLRVAAVSSFGIGGTNAHAILEEAPVQDPLPATKPAYCLTLSARTAQSLEALRGSYLAFLSGDDLPSFADLCFTSNVGRKPFAHRIAIAASGAADAARRLADATAATSDGQPHRIVVSTPAADANATWQAICGGDIDPREPLFEAADRYSAAELVAAYAALLVAQLRRLGLAAALRQPAHLPDSLVELLAPRRDDPLRELIAQAPADASQSDYPLTLSAESELRIGTRVHALGAPSLRGRFVAELLAAGWAAGVPVDWASFHADEARRKTSLPAYAFAKKALWLSTATEAERRNRKIEDIGQWFYKPTWRETAALAARTRRADEPADASVLVFSADRAHRLAAPWAAAARCLYVVPGAGFGELSDDTYCIDPASEGDYQRLIETLAARGRLPRRVVHAWLAAEAAWDGTPANFANCQTLGLFSLIFFARSLNRVTVGSAACSIVVAASQMAALTPREEVNPDKATVLGISRTLQKEYPFIDCRIVDIASHELFGATDSAAQLGLEFLEPLTPENEIVVLRGARRWQTTYQRFAVPAKCEPDVQARGVYVIFGGLGELGLNVAAHLASRAPCTLLLVNSKRFVARDEWPAWIDEHGADHPYSKKIEKIREMEKAGATVLLQQCDVADAKRVDAVLDDARERHGVIHSVIHAAGRVENGMIDNKDVRHFETVFEAKVYGTYNLLSYLKRHPVTKVILCSSMNSIIGGLGQIDNAAANAFVDAVAQTSLAASLGDICSTNWGAVNAERLTRPNVLPQFADLSREHMRNHMTEREIAAVYDRILHWNFGPRLVISTIDFDSVLEHWGEVSKVTELARLRHVAAEAGEQASARAPDDDGYAYRSELHRFVETSWARILGVAHVDWDGVLLELGAHSLSAVQFVSMVKDRYDVSLHAMIIYEIRTLGLLVEHIETKLLEKAAQLEVSQ